MRKALIGLVGIIAILAGQTSALPADKAPKVLTKAELADNLVYRIAPSIFWKGDFPAGSFEQEDIVRRQFPDLKVTTTFYDASYNEVKQPVNPGRYGAVARIHVADGIDLTRFLTLYRAPKQFNWRQVHFPAITSLPPELGLDPAVEQTQANAIGEGIRDSFGESTSSNPAILLAGLSEITADSPPVVRRNGPAARDADWWYGLRQKLGLVEKYAYLTDLPTDYAADPHKKWPLILFLHGAGERGNHLPDVRKNGLAKLTGTGKFLPAIVISPQCPKREWWKPQVLTQLLDEVCAKYRVDADHVYITGLSMGGFGTWDLAQAHPERFAAIATVCGGGDPEDAARLKDIPVWSFHGGKDDTVPIQMTLDMVNAVRKAGGEAHLTIFPEAGHNSWTQAYATDALYTWLLAQKRGQPEVKTPGMPAP